MNLDCPSDRVLGVLRGVNSPARAMSRLLPCLILSALPLVLSSCAVKQTVAPLSSRETLALNADDVVTIMRRAGFSDEQILTLGTDVRNCLAQTGAAMIQVDGKCEAIMAVYGTHIHVTSRRCGSFIYDVSSYFVL